MMREDFLFEWNIIIHNEKDLPDALTTHPIINFLWDKRSHEFHFRMKHFSKSSTKSRPCTKYQTKTCRDVALQRKIAEKYGCQIPIFYSGKHLDDYEDLLYLSSCNNSVIMEAILLSEEDFGCSKSFPCEHTDYSIGRFNEEFIHSPNSQTLRYFRFSFWQYVEYHQSYVSVNEQTLIGKIGGIIGILLGWSGKSMFNDLVGAIFKLF